MKRYSSDFLNYCRGAAIGVSALCISLGAAAQGAISAISASVQAGVETLKIDFSEPIAGVSTGFATQSPPRIALDFQGIVNASGKSVYEINLGNLKSVNVVQAGDRARIVLNLKTPTAYRTELQGNSLLLAMESGQSEAQVSSTRSSVFSEAQNREILPLKDIDFRRGADGSGRVVVNLSSNQVGVDLQ